MSETGDRNVNVMLRIQYWSMGISLAGAASAVLFITNFIQLTTEQRHTLYWCIGVVFPVIYLAFMGFMRRPESMLARYWKEFQAGQRMSHAAEIRTLYATAMNYPRLRIASGVAFWSIGTVLISVAMGTLAAVDGYGVFKIAFIGGTIGLLSSFFSFFAAKNQLYAVQASFGSYRNVEGLARGVRVVPMRAKLLTTFVTLVVISSAVAGLMTYESASTALEQERVDRSYFALDAMLAGFGEIPAGTLTPERLRTLARASGVDPRATVAILANNTGEPVIQSGDDHLTEMERKLLVRRQGVDSTTLNSHHVFVAAPIKAHPWILVIHTPWNLVSKNLSSLYRRLLIPLLLLLCIAVSLAYLAARDVSNALSTMVDWSRRVAAGEVGARILVESEDELGQLAWSLHEMSARLQEMILKVRITADGVDRSSADLLATSRAVMVASDEQSSGVLEATGVIEQMNTSMKGIAENTDRLSISAEESSSSILEMGATVEEVSGNMESLGRSVDESVSSIEQMTGTIREVARNVEGLSEVAEVTSSSMEEMVASIRQVEENAGETRRLSMEMVDVAELGREKVSATMAGIEAIRVATEEAGRVITSLGGRAQEIGEILDVIDEVAEETNLLALNAAIIAAQAGEHGRGFSVVADEIKDLAERVGVSTKEIGKLIRAVQEESGNAVSAVRRGSEMVAEGVRLSQEAGNALEAITASSRRSGEMVGEIAQATSEQSKGSQQAVGAMERVRDMVAQIRAAMGEQTRGSEQLIKASESMRQVTLQVRETIREHARGSGRITSNIESIREMVDKINHAIQEQQRGTEQAVTALERIRDRTERNLGGATQMGEAVKGLVAQADTLKFELARLKLDVEASGAQVPLEAKH